MFIIATTTLSGEKVESYLEKVTNRFHNKRVHWIEEKENAKTFETEQAALKFINSTWGETIAKGANIYVLPVEESKLQKALKNANVTEDQLYTWLASQAVYNKVAAYNGDDFSDETDENVMALLNFIGDLV